MARVVLVLTVQLPWWWRVYLWGLMFYAWCGFPVDTDIAAKFITDHAKCKAEPEK